MDNNLETLTVTVLSVLIIGCIVFSIVLGLAILTGGVIIYG